MFPRVLFNANLGSERDERLPRRDAGEGGGLEVLHEPVHPPPLPLIHKRTRTIERSLKMKMPN